MHVSSNLPVDISLFVLVVLTDTPMSSFAASEGEDWGDVTPILARGLKSNINSCDQIQIGCVCEIN